ncbi:hypothetical protein TNCV_82961 [Trichonephila clavipes]|nr:hypothetical protein TNCV_82961 [Trichonephila clavipes]
MESKINSGHPCRSIRFISLAPDQETKTANDSGAFVTNYPLSTHECSDRYRLGGWSSSPCRDSRRAAEESGVVGATQSRSRLPEDWRPAEERRSGAAVLS